MSLSWFITYYIIKIRNWKAFINHVILPHSCGVAALGISQCAKLPSRCAVESAHTIQSQFIGPQEPKIQTCPFALLWADKDWYFGDRVSPLLWNWGWSHQNIKGSCWWFCVPLQTGEVKLGGSFVSPESTSFFQSSSLACQVTKDGCLKTQTTPAEWLWSADRAHRRRLVNQLGTRADFMLVVLAQLLLAPSLDFQGFLL